MRTVTLTSEQVATIITSLQLTENEMVKSAARFFASAEEKAACVRVIDRCRDAKAAVRARGL